MKKLIFFLTLLLSLTNLFSQENPIYGSKVIIRKRDTSSAELQIINSTRNIGGFLKNTGGGNTIFKIPSQSEIAALPDSLLVRYTKTQADARFKSISYIPDWLELTGVPSNFSTTYALSNDIQDSLLNKVTRSGSYADPSWITSLNYSKLVGTVPTWNQNTTGNAATVTNGVYTTSSYANPAWITSLDYSKLTGTIPTWNQNTTGNAATVTNGVYTTGSYADPSWIASLAWSKISGAPAFITGINSSMVTSALGYTPENISNKGIANGYADLDAGGKIPASRIDFGQTGQTFVVASQAAMLAVSGANIGALAVRTDESKNYRLIAQPASTLANWQLLLSPDAPVQSVNGFTGNVNLLTTHISEGSNYWWTAARSRSAQSLTTSGSSGSATYDNSTGVLNVPTYTLAGLGGISLTSLSFTPGSGGYNSSTGVITIPTNTNQLTNGAGFITGYTETDPTIYAWAKAATKPSYSWTEIGSRPTALSQFSNDLIYSWALQATKPSYTFGEIGGTVPTWNQSTTGNAATSSSAPLLSSISASSFNSSQTPTSLNYGIQTYFVGPAVGEGSWQNYGSIVNVRTYSGGGASMQMYIPYSPNYGGTGLQVRFGNYDVSLGDSWTSWKTLLATDNYNSYAPSLTGTGASGNWGINITGNAASATTWFNAGQYDAVGNNANASAFMGFNTSTGKWAAYQVSYMQGWLGLGSAAFTASSAYYAAGSTVNNSTNFAGIGYGGGYSSGTISYSMVYNSTNSRWEAATAGNIQTWLGLGSNAYSSTSFFPISGGTLAGHLNMGGWNISNVTNISGASLDLTGSISLNNGEFLKARRTSGSALIPILGFESGTDDLIQVFSNSWKLRGTGGIGDEKITVLSTGRVGVGTNNPVNARLEVVAASGEVFRADAASGALRIVADQTGVMLAGATTILNGFNLTGGTLPATVGSTLSYAYNSPSHTFAFGDGTGYNLKFVKRAASMTTDLFTLTDAGVGSFASSLTSGGSIYAVNIQASNLLVSTTSSEFLRSIPNAAGAAQFQAWYNSVGTRRGFFGFGGTSSDILYLHNETGGTLDFVGSNSNFSNTVTAYGYSTNSTAGGWDRAFSFKGSGGTNRGGFGAFGTDNTLEYYYIGQDYTSTAIRVAYSNYVVGLATDLQFRSNAGFGILSENGNRVISITNGAMNVTGTANISSTLTASSLIRSGGTSSQFLKADGSIDANSYATTASLSSYATTSSLSGYVDISSNQYEIGGNKTFLADVVVNGKLTGGRILGNTATYTSAATISSVITTAFCSNSSGSNYTLTMPSASGVTGQIMTVILTSGTLANTVTLSGINGGSYVLTCYASVVLVSNGSTWNIASVYNNTAPCS